MCPVRWVCALVLHGCPGLGQAKKKAGKKAGKIAIILLNFSTKFSIAMNHWGMDPKYLESIS